MLETWVRLLGWEDPLKKGMAIHSSILAMDRGAWWATVHGVTKSQTRLSDFFFPSFVDLPVHIFCGLPVHILCPFFLIRLFIVLYCGTY